MEKKNLTQSRELNFIDKLLAPQMRSKINELVLGDVSSPVIVELDPTSNCNFSCPECINHDLINNGQFSEEQLLNLIAEFKKIGVKGLIFIGGGEPLAHSSMPRPLVFAKEIGLKIGLTTNGSLIERHINEIADCVDWTRVSLDAGCESTHSIFRPSKIRNAFSKIILSMEKLAQKKSGLLGYSFLIVERKNGLDIETNIHELYSSAVLAKDIGCDYFEFKPMVDDDHNLVPLSTTSKDILLTQMDKMEKLNDERFRVIFPASVFHILSCGNSIQQEKNYQFCPAVELRTVVTPSGVYPCPYKRGRMLLSNSYQEFSQFWSDSETRKILKQIDPSKDCPFYCIRNDMNILLNAVINTYTNGVNLLDYLSPKNKNDDVFL